MKLIISISNYLKSVDVFVDGVRVEISKLSFSSKAIYEHTVKSGIHDIYVIKKSEVLEKNWKTHIIYDWISCLLGIPDWTLKEKKLDVKICSIRLKIEVVRNIQVKLDLTDTGFMLVEHCEGILDTEKQIHASAKAEQRIKTLYLIPALILSMAIEICFLLVSFFFITNRYYPQFFVFLALSIFWPCLLWCLISRKN